MTTTAPPGLAELTAIMAYVDFSTSAPTSVREALGLGVLRAGSAPIGPGDQVGTRSLTVGRDDALGFQARGPNPQVDQQTQFLVRCFTVRWGERCGRVGAGEDGRARCVESTD